MQTNGTAKVSVLIPAYNEAVLIGRVIDSVRESFAAIGRDDYEIVVCDNNSTDGTRKLAEAEGARVVFEPHNQISRARNCAAAAAAGEWFIFLDSDTFLAPELLGDTLSALESGVIAGGGATLAFDRAGVGLFARLLTGLWNSISRMTNVAAGSYIFCMREAWVEVGGFNEDFYAGEELVFSRDIKRWAKERGMRFKVLGGSAIVTSGRKMEWYSQWQLFYRFVGLMRPGAIKRRESCGLWYTRPGG